MPRKQFNNTFTNQISELKELCTDPITLQPFEDPYVIGKCGHTAEKKSLYEWMKRQCVCPVCQTPIETPPVPNYLMRQILPAINHLVKVWEERAAANSNHTITRLLCKNADVNATDQKGETPLHRIARQGSISRFQALLAKGAVDSKNKAGVTASEVLTQQWQKLEEKKKLNNPRSCGPSRICGQ